MIIKRIESVILILSLISGILLLSINVGKTQEIYNFNYTITATGTETTTYYPTETFTWTVTGNATEHWIKEETVYLYKYTCKKYYCECNRWGCNCSWRYTSSDCSENPRCPSGYSYYNRYTCGTTTRPNRQETHITKTDSGEGKIDNNDFRIISEFNATPLPQHDGILSDTHFKVSWDNDNDNVEVCFSDTHSNYTANPYAKYLVARIKNEAQKNITWESSETGTANISFADGDKFITTSTLNAPNNDTVWSVSVDNINLNAWMDGNNLYVHVKSDTITMNLPKGWSMISLPLVPENTSLISLFPGAKVVYGYEKVTGYMRVKQEDSLEAKKGYWILMDQAKTYELYGQPITNYSLSVNDSGWLMIGGCSSDVRALSENCAIKVIYGYDQETGYKRVLESENLKPAKGYWILLDDVEDQCELTVEVIEPPVF